MFSSSKTPFQVTKENLDKLHSLISPDVEAKLLKGGEEGLTERTLTRWLNARKGDLNKACSDLTQHASWREEHVPLGYVPEADIMSDLCQDKCFLMGTDKDGHPTLLARVKDHKIAKHPKDFERFMTYVLDGGIALGKHWEIKTGRAWDGKITGILNLKDIHMSNCDTHGLITIFTLLQNHFVERLHRMYLYCAPSIFYGLWAVVKPFVDPVTRKKVMFVYEKDAAEIFAQDYEPDVIPAELGGSGPDRPIQAQLKQIEEERKQFTSKHEELSASTDNKIDSGSNSETDAQATLTTSSARP